MHTYAVILAYVRALSSTTYACRYLFPQLHPPLRDELAARPASELGLLLLERSTAAQLIWLDKPADNQLCDAVLRISLDQK